MNIKIFHISSYYGIIIIIGGGFMFFKFLNNVILKKNFYFLILLALIIWFMCKNVDVAGMFFAALLFACSLSPIVDKLSKKMSRTLAATLVLAGVIVLINIFVLPILAMGAYQVTEFAKEFPVYIANLDDNLAKIPMLQNMNIAHIDMNSVMDSVADSSSTIIDNILEFIAKLGSAFLYIFTTIVFIFFFLTDQENIKKNLLKLFPSEIRGKTDKIFETITDKLSGYVLAQTLVSGSVWVTMTLGLMLCNIKYAVILGLVAGVMSIIPVVGSAISFFICLIATYESGLGPMAIVTVLFTLSHFIENHVVRPYVYSKMLSLHPVLIFLSLVVGAKYAGVLGVIFAPPFTMALCILLEELYVKEMES